MTGAGILDAVASALDGVSQAALTAAYARQSDTYRAGGATPGDWVEVDVLAYAAARMPATYAAVARVLADLREGLPGFAPATVLDLGAGPGTAGWAAVEAFPSIEGVHFVEHSLAMSELGRSLAAGSGVPVLRDAGWTRGDARRPPSRASLVIASYVLNELPQPERADVVRAWWESAADVLVVVEPGTPLAWRGVRAARETAVALGAHVVAPCPSAPGCAAVDEDWCHFAERVPRTRLHRLLKGGTLGFEDEKYSYVTLSRSPVAAAARVVGQPSRHGGHVRLAVCDDGGVTERVVSKRDAETYRWARRAEWGDRVPESPADPGG